MRRTVTVNMTEGRPLILLAGFALPLLVGNLFQQAYNLADSMIVGRMLGADALAAVGATGSISFLFFSFFNGISGGCGILTAKHFGARQDNMVRLAISNSAYIMQTASLITGMAAFLLTPAVLGWMGTPPEILPDAVIYMRMITASAPLVAVYNYSSSMQRALGDSRTPLYFLIVSCVINVGLDLLFIGAFGMGVFGAALATMLSQLLAGLGSLGYAFRFNPYFRLGRKDIIHSPAIIRGALRLGLPLALQWSLIAVSTTALQTVVNSFGAVAVAAFTATNRLEQLVQQPFASMSMALSTYSGQNMGAGKMDRIRMGFRDSLLAMLVLAGVMLLIMQLFGRGLVGLFVHERSVIELGGQALRITSVFYAALGLIYVTRGVLNGVGDAFFSLLNGIVEIAGRVGFPLLLLRLGSPALWAAFERALGLSRTMAAPPPASVWVIWITAGATWLLSGFFCVLRYISWRQKAKNGEVIRA
ncbi:MAG: MATE family efflux transporter [Oscillospiraceae bacterium]|nr:MATE family efflux transporter [Oscillospiraceae bacterium]